MATLDKTTALKIQANEDAHVKALIVDAVEVMTRLGYKPIPQLVGYLSTGDPTYITSKEGLRARFHTADREDILHVLLNAYVKGHADFLE